MPAQIRADRDENKTPEMVAGGDRYEPGAQERFARATVMPAVPANVKPRTWATVPDLHMQNAHSAAASSFSTARAAALCNPARPEDT
jgi:hypothetical protein